MVLKVLTKMKIILRMKKVLVRIVQKYVKILLEDTYSTHEYMYRMGSEICRSVEGEAVPQRAVHIVAIPGHSYWVRRETSLHPWEVPISCTRGTNSLLFPNKGCPHATGRDELIYNSLQKIPLVHTRVCATGRVRGS